MFLWTQEEIEKILMQLNTIGLPFAKHPFAVVGEKPVLLGSGGYAHVYEASDRSAGKQGYAIKVIGFGDQYADEQMFHQTIQTQMDLGLYQEHVVKVYDAVCLDVWLDQDDNVSRAELRSKDMNPTDRSVDHNVVEESENRRYLQLQFVLMEKLDAVLTKTEGHSYRLFPPALASFQEAEVEAEIRKLALDIGTALAAAHDKKILHRDIKPENLFYSSRTGQYKLGDFGIALKTADGMASTIAYTDGYGAPEIIRRSDDKYDVTADIYSLGMTLYVLLNRLKFPGSGGYRVNAKQQYEKGFVLPGPETGSDAFVRIIEKMCRFDPGDRYQSMDEVLLELRAITDGDLVKYQRAHEQLLAVLGSVFLIMGMAMWKLTFLPDLEFVLSPVSYLFLVLCVVKFLLAEHRRDTTLFKLFTLVSGGWLCFSTGFAWWKPVLLLLLFAEDTLGGFWGMGILAANFAYLLAGKDAGLIRQMQDHRWAAVTLLPLAGVFILQFYAISAQERSGRQNDHLTEFFLRNNLPWVFAMIYFGTLLLWGVLLPDLMTEQNLRILESIPGVRWLLAILSAQPLKAGVAGFVFSVFWMARQGILKRR